MLGIVFVHGINSSPSMWDAFADLLAHDPELTQILAEPTPRFGYATGLWRPWWRPLQVIPSITTAADSLKEYLTTEAGRYEGLVLVGHSQGGLVIQRCLVRLLSEGRGRELARIRRVVLLARPNTGSQLALAARRALIRSNPQERALRPYDELMADTLRVIALDVIYAPSEPSDRSCRIPFSIYVGEQDGVVTRASAQAMFPEAAALPGDHFSIARPTSHDHRTYATVKRLLLQAARGDRDPPVKTATSLGPAALEVHNAGDIAHAASGRAAAELETQLTAYLPRAFDAELRNVLSLALAGGPSRLVMLTGESSTGKTRALYEALLEGAPQAPLLRVTDTADLLLLLESKRIPSGCVLWLNEAQRYLYGAGGERAASRLHNLLARTSGIAAVGTMWSKPYWNQLTATSEGDPHGQARALLTHPQFAIRIQVPTHVRGEDLAAWQDLADSTDDVRLRHALDAGASDGRVVQHLSGGPELLTAYLEGPGEFFTHREHALLTAALDARRLGHHGPLTADLLAEAADGDLNPRHRSSDGNWAHSGLQALANGKRNDGTTTVIRNALTAMTAVRPHSGAPPAYEPADYLDQHTRRMRADRRGSEALWAALLKHTPDREDQVRLGQAAWNRGLRTIAIHLWNRSVAAGHPITPLVRLGAPDTVGLILPCPVLDKVTPLSLVRGRK
ncbi:alpha/beta fold hydrolase [Catenulispora pinisilvae]|uniref:alpha/beta fold hydrolase n=1 Tax=Catenulispora pinisilvae TaxID=2705253 RepID=UPI0018918192|nr:alpha/beta fold hydrolase [Catenulispora pinisilvae]